MKQKKRETLYDNLARISSNALYDGLLGEGLFADKLPPVFTSRPFCDWCKLNSFASDGAFPKEGTPYVMVECMRNTNVPRVMGIPNPFTYEYLCSFLREHWDDLKSFFKIHTLCQGHKISQLHLQRMKGTAALFQMNYRRKDESSNPLIPDLMMGKRYEVHTDISSFFPSVYSHSLVWALESKNWAKKNRKKYIFWQNELDRRVQMIKYNETNGLLIGPHVSNLLSEIILARVDERLCDKDTFKYIRCIDDCTCFAESKEAAERFIVDQAAELKEYGLSLNAKKTKILEMPVPMEERWVRTLKAHLSHLPDNLDLGMIRTFIDLLLELLRDTGDTAVISYAMAPLAQKVLTEPARLYYVKILLHLSSIYPYLYSYLDERLFQPFGVEVELLRPFFAQMLRHGLESKNYEEASYALYFSMRYGVKIEAYDVKKVIATKDCVLLCLALLYTRDWRLDEAPLHDYALQLQTDGMFWEYWVFVYEALRPSEFSGKIEGRFNYYVKTLKNAGISFLISVDAISAVYSIQWDIAFIKWDLEYFSGTNDGNETSPLAILWNQFADKYPEEANDVSLAYLNAIVTNLYIGRFTRHNVSVPYSDNTFYLHAESGPTGEAVDTSVVRRMFGWLEKCGYVGKRVGNLSEGEGVYYWAKNPMGCVFSKMKTECVRRKTFGEEDCVVVLKDAEKNMIANAILDEKAKNYSESLKNINSTYARHCFAIDAGHGLSMQRFAPCLRAIFNNSSWNEGGRMYAGLTTFGLNYQNVPATMRRSITIDGQECVELDYSALHINILYAQKGESLGHIDPYACGSKVLRPLVKKALLLLLNAHSRAVVTYMLEEWRKELFSSNSLTEHEKQAKDAFLHSPDVGKLLTSIERKHSKIADKFYSGVGVKLQNIDSQIALTILKYFSQRDIPVLPVHDSFIIAEEHKDELHEVMQKAYCDFCGGEPCVIREV